jgi:putative salt-induced outer membrane protein YdiY
MVRLPAIDAVVPEAGGPTLTLPRAATPAPAAEPIKPNREEIPAEEAIAAEPLSAWYQPQHWLGPQWTGAIELGMNGSTGNSEAFSMRVGANLKRETPLYTTSLEISHARTSADSVDTQNNALGKITLDRNLGDSPWTLFGTGTAEYDEFKAFDLRLAAHVGVGYKAIQTEASSLIVRLGSGVSHEIGGPDDSYVPEALFGLDFEHKISAKQKLRLKADYFPEWSDLTNYRMVTEASWECLLDEASNLSLKLGAIDRYDSTPNGRKHNDLDYTALLLWKL